jgi:osmotically-inducible protein OsmY
VFNLETENIKFIGDMIQHAVQQEPFKTTPESQKIMEDLALASLVNAAISSNPDTRDVALNVRADQGIVTISGKVKTQEAADSIKQVAESVPGVKEVKSDIDLNYRYQHVET